jgi:transketolase
MTPDRQTMGVADLERLCREVRRRIITMTAHAGCGHTGGSLSAVELLVALYFRILRLTPEAPDWPERDRFVLSKGHATPLYYTVLARRGFFPDSLLETYDTVDSLLQGHPCMRKTPGVDMSTGSLGQGISSAIGMAMGCRARGMDFRTYVLLGDGELQEGQVWEAALYAGSRVLTGLVVIVDNNGVQLTGTTRDVLPLEPLADKWRAFGWTVLGCDGHAMAEVVPTLEQAREQSAHGPVVVLADTVKGKGVSFMENRYQWHGRAPDADECALALAELEEDRA